MQLMMKLSESETKAQHPPGTVEPGEVDFSESLGEPWTHEQFVAWVKTVG